MNKSKLTDILLYIVSAETIGALSAWLSGGYSDFFDKYERPPLQPPMWVFPVVWTILYALMGYSAYLVSQSDDRVKAKPAMTIYWAQLAVNFLWSIVFFRFEMLWGGFAVIILLLVLAAVMIALFSRVNKLAAAINIPYLLWIAFASYLNYQTAIINI